MSDVSLTHRVNKTALSNLHKTVLGTKHGSQLGNVGSLNGDLIHLSVQKDAVRRDSVTVLGLGLELCKDAWFSVRMTEVDFKTWRSLETKLNSVKVAFQKTKNIVLVCTHTEMNKNKRQSETVE